jgi:hypothetical protein
MAGTSVTLTKTVTRVFAVIRQMAAFAAAAIAGVNVGTLPASVRGSFVVFSAILLGVEHYNQTKTTTTPSVKAGS